MARINQLKENKKYNLRDQQKKKLKKNKDDSDDSDIDIEDSSEYETVSETDSSYEPSKFKKNKKRVVEEDDDEDESEDDDESDDEDIMSPAELAKFISKVFPSKHSNERAKLLEQSNKNKNKNKKSVSRSSTSKRDKDSGKKKSKRSLKKQHDSDDEDTDDEDDEDDEDDSDDDDEDDSDDDDDDEDEDKTLNIMFTINGDGDYDDDEEEYNEEDDDDECNSDDEEAFMKETYERIDNDNDDSNVKSKKSKKDKKNKKDKKTDDAELTDVEHEYKDLIDTKKLLTLQLVNKPKSKVLIHAISDCNDSINKLIKKARSKNAKLYHNLIYGAKKQPNEVDYFRKKLSNKEQLRIMKGLKEINSHINIEKPYRLALLDSKMPAKFKAVALQKLNVLRAMDPCDNEYYKIKNWVDTFMRIPFGMYKNLSVKMDDGLDVCHEFMSNAMTTLNDCVYGLDDAKLQIMQMLGQWMSNPSAMGTSIAIKGPMGTGKTTLVKEGISKILGREFAFIALGGTGDSSFLEGHSYTYEGSSWGKIVQIIIDSKCMNPVIYFDELDKISDTPRGEEIIGILTHLTDTSQNNQFHDKYFSEVDFDLSKCLFIFSYNDESKVNPILRDRMYRIQTKGYDSKEKVTIARNYLLPKIREQVNFTDEDVIIPDDTLQYIISNSSMTKEEAGVRNLKRCLEIIYTKLNLFRLVKSGSNIFGKEIDMKVSFPITVTKKEVDILIKNEENQHQSMLAMYV